jgi:subtilisin-like proprotein convertase family protein
VKNDVCGVGVAYEAHVAGVRILSGPISDVDEAAALNYRYQENHVYSCSWGPPDDGRSMDAPKGLIAKAMLNGIQNGRGGKGSIFVFAGGNGGASDDQCNFDGYTNSIYSMTIAAVDREGLHPYYSEMCAANIASGWSSGSGDHIHTTDVAWNGVNRCTTHHGGTSAAAPLVAGVVALALATRPDLTWRDMQHIAVKSAVMVAPDDKDWQQTQAGRHYNHKFGYGVIDAYQFVEEAKRHVLVKPQAWAASPNISIARDDTLIGLEGVKSTFTVTKDWLAEQNLESIEHVTARVWITHERRGDVDVELTSPHGTRSVLARPRRYDDARTGFVGWGFMSLKHWGEDPVGTWTMEVFDRANPKQTGNFWAWSMTLWGETMDASKAKVWNFPEDSVEYHETLPAAPSTTTVYQPELVSSQRPKPTDHLPEDHGSKPGETSADFTHSRPTLVRLAADTCLPPCADLCCLLPRRLRRPRRTRAISPASRARRGSSSRRASSSSSRRRSALSSCCGGAALAPAALAMPPRTSSCRERTTTWPCLRCPDAPALERAVAAAADAAQRSSTMLLARRPTKRTRARRTSSCAAAQTRRGTATSRTTQTSASPSATSSRRPPRRRRLPARRKATKRQRTCCPTPARPMRRAAAAAAAAAGKTRVLSGKAAGAGGWLGEARRWTGWEGPQPHRARRAGSMSYGLSHVHAPDRI